MFYKVRKFLLQFGWILLVMAILNGILYYFEKGAPGTHIFDYEDCWWYMMVTLPSVGYGDIVPVTNGGRVIGYIYLVATFLSTAYIIGTVTTKIQAMIEDRKLGLNGTNFKDHIIFIGWNDFSHMVADECIHSGKPLAIVTNRKDDIDFIYNRYDKSNTFVLFSDYNDYDLIEKVNPSKAAEVFINLGDDTEALIYVINFKKRYPKPGIIVSLEKSYLEETFEAAGVTYAVSRNRIASKLVASYIFEPDVAALNLDILSSAKHDEDFDNQQYLVTEKNPFKGKDCLEVFIELKTKYNATVLGISKKVGENDYKLITAPTKDVIIEAGDYLIMIINGSSKNIIASIFGVSEGRS